MEPANTSAQSPEKNKLVVGWFSFTCSEDSTILFTELLNDHFNEWKTLVEFRHLKALKTNNSINDLDVAFIEGAISSEKQAVEVTKIRNNSKYVVAVGAARATDFRPQAEICSFRRTLVLKPSGIWSTLITRLKLKTSKM